MDGDIATIGITDHAQDALTDIVYIEFRCGDLGCFIKIETFSYFP